MDKKAISIIILIILICSLGGYFAFKEIISGGEGEKTSDNPLQNIMDQNKNMIEEQNKANENSKNLTHKITLKTSKGDIEFLTYDADAPNTVKNFINLADKNFYNGIIFHRVINGFMIQGGDPFCSRDASRGICGTGGPGYKFNDELNSETESYKNGYKTGVVAMANSGPNTNGSQFFIMLADNALPNAYTIFGKVVKGQDVVSAIGAVQTDQNDKPLENVVINDVVVEEAK